MTDKKIIALSLLGIIKSNEPWKQAHRIGMKELAEKSGMQKLIGKEQDEEYFKLVEEALGKIEEYKELSGNERIAKRRDQYFERVSILIKEGGLVDKDFVDFLESLKEDYEIILITTNKKEFVKDILNFAKAEDIFDSAITSKPDEKDDKKIVFERAIKKGEKPDIFIGSEKSGTLCKEFGIKFIKHCSIKKIKEELKNE